MAAPQSAALQAQISEKQDPHPHPLLSTPIVSYIIAGGLAGATSRTVVSPLERLKVILQVQPRSSSSQYTGVWRSLCRMWTEEGFRGLMRGNGVNCLRIAPYSAVQFTTYETLKKWLTSYGSKELDTPKRLTAGALAGICSVCSTYPLDLVRARLSIATASIPVSVPPSASAPTTGAKISLSAAYHTSSYAASELTILGMTKKIVREEGGVRGLYRGIATTAFGVAPYVATNFAAYEYLEAKLACGALAGSISQTLTYPFDVLRRKMQVSGMKSSGLGIKYSGALDALRGTVRSEGVIGLYRGLWPNLLKVAPSIATSFFTYELVKEYLLGQ
ncbi:mitochondrial carrier domain-containing protein [Mycena amicta]|nr:mitochondrial carrier domain-containing protein [Mycena amicta]